MVFMVPAMAMLSKCPVFVYELSSYLGKHKLGKHKLGTPNQRHPYAVNSVD